MRTQPVSFFRTSPFDENSPASNLSPTSEHHKNDDITVEDVQRSHCKFENVPTKPYSFFRSSPFGTNSSTINSAPTSDHHKNKNITVEDVQRRQLSVNYSDQTSDLCNKTSEDDNNNDVTVEDDQISKSSVNHSDQTSDHCNISESVHENAQKPDTSSVENCDQKSDLGDQSKTNYVQQPIRSVKSDVRQSICQDIYRQRHSRPHYFRRNDQRSFSFNRRYTPLSCHFNKEIDPVNRIKPQRKIGVVYESTNRLERNTQVLDKPVYTQMNSKDVISVIKGYLYLWKNLRRGNAAMIRDFIISRVFRINQNHANLYLQLHCPAIVDQINGINYRYFLDLIVKSVVDYQDGKLVKRKYEPGYKCVWNNKQYYCQYADRNGTEILPYSGPEYLLPQDIRFQRKHPIIYFHEYDAAEKDHDHFSATDNSYRSNQDTNNSHLEREEKEDLKSNQLKSDVRYSNNNDEQSVQSSQSKSCNSVVSNSEEQSRQSSHSVVSQPDDESKNSLTSKDSFSETVPNAVEVNSIEIPEMNIPLKELYSMVQCEGVYRDIKCKDISYREIPNDVYREAILRTYHKFCKFCDEQFEQFLWSNDDEHGSLREEILDQQHEIYKSHNYDTWWLDLPGQKYHIFKFLGLLCVNPVWDLGFRKKDTVSDISKHYFPCYCPCHKRFEPYFDAMSNAFLAEHRKKSQCRGGAFLTPKAFKAHLHDINHWSHMLLKISVTELYEAKPGFYDDNIIKPVPLPSFNDYDPGSDSQSDSQTSVNNIPSKTHSTKG